MTDDDRTADPLPAARLLPKGAMIIVRSRDNEKRQAWARALLAISHGRGTRVLIANDAKLALRCGADGLHLSESNAKLAARWRALHPRWFISAAVHSERAALACTFLDAILLSPVFPTQSHPSAGALLPARANRIAAACRTPVYALGGVTAQNAGLLHGFAGIAAIGALMP